MSRCSEDRMNQPKAEKLEELDLVTQFIVKEILKEYPTVYVFGSRRRGNWRFCSDFDIAINLPNPNERIIKEKEYSDKFGVKIELRDGEFYERNPTDGLKIERND